MHVLPLLLFSLLFLAVLYPSYTRKILLHFFTLTAQPFMIAENAGNKSFKLTWNTLKTALKHVGIQGNHSTQRLIGQLVGTVCAIVTILCDADVLVLTFAGMLNVEGANAHLIPFAGPHIHLAFAAIFSLTYWGILGLDLAGLTHWSTFDLSNPRVRRLLIGVMLLVLFLLFSSLLSLAYWRGYSTFQMSSNEVTAEQLFNQMKGAQSPMQGAHQTDDPYGDAPTWIPMYSFVAVTFTVACTAIFALPSISALLVLVVGIPIGLIILLFGGVLYAVGYVGNRINTGLYNVLLAFFNFLARPFRIMSKRSVPGAFEPGENPDPFAPVEDLDEMPMGGNIPESPPCPDGASFESPPVEQEDKDNGEFGGLFGLPP